jgi:hypothetical protein
MLELDDIQYILVTRVPALTGRYEFLSFREPAQGRAWLRAIREKVPSAKAVADTVNMEKRWVSVALTSNGLRALGLDEASLATFPEEFRQGMAARWQVVGDTGTNHPDNLDRRRCWSRTSRDRYFICPRRGRERAERS